MTGQKKQELKGHCVTYKGKNGVICEECLINKNYQIKEGYTVIAKIHTRKDIPKDFIHKDNPQIKRAYYCHECGSEVLPIIKKDSTKRKK